MNTLEVNRNFNQDNRDKWVRYQISQLSPNQSILDVGAGNEPYKQSCSHLVYTSFDKSEFGSSESTGLAEKWDLKTEIVGNAEELPYENKCFNNILCTEVIEHTPNPIKLISEIARVLKNEGKLILTAPFNSLYHFSPDYYYSGFSKEFYYHHFSNNGLEIKEITPNGNYFRYLIQEMNRISYVSKKYSSPIGVLDNFFIKKVRGILNRLDDKNKGSEELLHFGYHILARKK